MSIWFFAAPFLLLAVVAIFAALASGIPEAQHEDGLYLAPEITDHERVAVENASATPIYEALAVEIFNRELDEKIREGLADWGKDGAA